MMDTFSWAWHTPAPWPGYNPDSQTNLGAIGNGLAIDPTTFAPIVWRDAEGDDRIADSDGGDASITTDDRVVIDGVEHTVREIGDFPGGSMIVNGTPLTVDFSVWLLDDGTYLVRIRDHQIPTDTHYTKVDSLTLGAHDGVNYSHSYVSTRDEPFLCFVAGTLIDTANGLLPVEDLSPGDLILTADHGYCPLRWVTRRRVAGRGPAAPVLITKGSLGNSRDLYLSQQHRIMLSDWRAEMLFGTTEVLIAAIHLVNGVSIRLSPCDDVDYVHILFDRHELVFSEGILTESFHPGIYSLSRLPDATRQEVFMLFPDLAQQPGAHLKTARPCLRAWEARALRAQSTAGRPHPNAR